MDDISILSRAKEIFETKNPEEIAQRLILGSWIVVDAISKPDGVYFLMLRLF